MSSSEASTSGWPERDLQLRLKVLVTPLSDFAILPTSSNSKEIRLEVYSPYTYTIEPFRTIQVRTDLQINLPVGVTGKVLSRPGDPAHFSVCVTTIPSNYKEAIEVTITNYSDHPIVINQGCKIARILPQTIEN